jgi:catechol 2,3-dioxygenase-like lactoylglutathione lyase family enzyme
MATVRWTTTVLDCPDPQALADFYAALLGGTRERINANFHVVKLGNAWLATQRVAAYTAPTWPDAAVPKQMHLDLSVDDLDSAVSTAKQLGATEEATQPAADHWRVMRDPAGHLFCLSHHIADYLPLDD